jgi:hypothetical protein
MQMPSHQDRVVVILALLSLCLVGSACMSAPVLSIEAKPVVAQEEGSKRAIPPQEIVLKSHAISTYLEGLAGRLAQSSPELSGVKYDIGVIRDQSSRWNSVHAGRGNLYLARGILKVLENENQLAAFLSIEMLQTKRTSLFPTTVDVKATGSETRIEVSPTAELMSLVFRTAVRVLYQGGYDPRGVLSLIQFLMKNSTVSPYDVAFMENLLVQVRREIAIFPPLRNPRVQSKSFLIFQKKVQQL